MASSFVGREGDCGMTDMIVVSKKFGENGIVNRGQAYSSHEP